MKKYEIQKRTAEIKYKDRFDIEPGCTADDPEPEKIAEFENPEEAREELKKYESSIYAFSSPIGTIYEVTEYIIQEVEIDEDGEVDDFGDVCEHSKLRIKVDNHFDTVATFDSFRDAEKFVNESEGDEELTIAI